MQEDDFDATRWLDRTLIRLSARFGEYRKDSPDTFTLAPELEYYPQFMFNLRRSQFVQVLTHPSRQLYPGPSQSVPPTTEVFRSRCRSRSWMRIFYVAAPQFGSADSPNQSSVCQLQVPSRPLPHVH